MLNFQNIVQQYFPKFASRHATLARVAGSALSFVFFQRRFEQFDREYQKARDLILLKRQLLSSISNFVLESLSECESPAPAR